MLWVFPVVLRLGLLLTCALVLSCDPGPSPGTKARVEAEPRKAAPAAPKVTAERRKPHLPRAIEWGTQVAWQEWEDGLAEAKRSGKPICMVVYADWCPKCRTLAPVFSDPEVVALSKKMVMVLQDSDQAPDSMTQKLGQFGNYVPRILFLDPQGNPNSNLKAPNPKYPYFYTPQTTAVLKQNMQRASAS